MIANSRTVIGAQRRLATLDKGRLTHAVQLQVKF